MLHGGHVAHYEKKQKILRSPHRQLSTVDKRRRLWHLCEIAAISDCTICRKVRTMVVSGSDAYAPCAPREIFFVRQIWRALRASVASCTLSPHRAQTASRRRCTRFPCSLWCVLPPVFAARARAASILRYASRPSGGSPDARAQTAAAPIATAQELPRARWPGNSICQVCARYSRGARATPRALCSRLSTNVLKRPARAPLAARRLIYARGALVSSRRPPGRTCARCVLAFRVARACAASQSAALYPSCRWPTV